MRRDSILNTGLTSNSINKAGREKHARELRKKAKDEKRSQLVPAIQIVIDELNKELESTQVQMLGLINGSTPTEDVKSIIVSLNLYSQSVKQLKTRISNIMRVRTDDESD